MSMLTDAQRDFIPKILEHVFPDKAARQCGLDVSVALQWMQNPTFRLELERQRKLVAQNVMFALEKYANKAVLALVEILDSSPKQELKIKAADAILSHTIEYRKLYGLEDRIEGLERMADEAKRVKSGK